MAWCIACLVEDALSRCTSRLRRAVHSGGVEVSLEGKAITKRGAVGTQVVPPIKGQGIDVKRADGFVKVAAALGVMNERNLALRSLAEHFDGSLSGWERNSLIILNGQQTSPRIEQLNCIGTAVIHLVGKQVPHGFGHVMEHLLCLVRLGEHGCTCVVEFLVARTTGHEVQ